jgi:2-polyprenyl-3-methyl-5-hydroxy-6-metoxy-1,4-benzoquinol methylase
MLEREVLEHAARRVLDAGCGEGRMALTLGARHPDISVEGLEVSRTNVRIAQRLNCFSNVEFHEALIEEADRILPPCRFDLVYCSGVLASMSRTWTK